MENVWEKYRTALLMLLVAVVMWTAFGRMNVQAADVVTGTWGDNISWTLDQDTGLLTISGEGDMKTSSNYYSQMPFYAYKDVIVTVVVEEGVTSICNYAFLSCANLTSISLPQGLEKIDDYAFEGDVSLTEIEFPNSLISIGEMTFYGCSSLTRLELPDSLTELGYGAFWNCTSLEELVLSASLTVIPDEGFGSCSSLKTVEIPASVTIISDSAFCATGLTSVTIPGSVRTIGEYAFSFCDNLETVIIEEGVEAVDDGAFLGDDVLASVTLPSSLVRFGDFVFDNTPYIENLEMNGSFLILSNGVLYSYEGTDASKITVPGNVRGIASSVFENHTELEAVVLPDDLLAIGAKAFFGCTMLADINVPDIIQYIGSYAFTDTPFMENIEEDMIVFGSVLYYYKGSAESVEIPEGITMICDEAFAFHYLLEEVTLPDTLEIIGTYAFLGCHSLTSLIVPASVTEIGDYAIGIYCDGGFAGLFHVMTAMTICGVSGSAAESYAETYGVSFLATDQSGAGIEEGKPVVTGTCGENVSFILDLSSGVLTLRGTGETEDYTYSTSPLLSYADKVTSIVVEEGVTTLGNYLFYSMSNLESAFLPETLTEIGDYTFLYCESLKTVIIPSGVSSISTSAFSGCSGLEALEADEDNSVYTSVEGILYNSSVTSLIWYPVNSPLTTYVVPATMTTVPYISKANNLRCMVVSENTKYCSNTAFRNLTALERVVFLGDAPKKSSYGSGYTDPVFSHDVVISYNASMTGWDSLVDGASYWEYITWEDISGYVSDTTLTIGRDAEVLVAGDTMQLNAQLSPTLAALFTWSSSEPLVARVSQAGLVTAVKAGTTVITCASADGVYKAAFTLTVTGEAGYTIPEYLNTELDSDMVGAPFTSMQFPMESLQGIYFLNDNYLYFYSISGGTYDLVRKFSGCVSAYEESNCLYILTSSSKLEVFDLEAQQVIFTMQVPGGYTGTAVGADASGRICIAAYASSNSANNRIFLYSADGTLLSYTASTTRVYSFSGFDEESGYFFMESQQYYYSWGYNREGRGVTIGLVTGNMITRVDASYGFLESGIISRTLYCFRYLYQTTSYLHQNGAEVIGGHYLVMRSVLHGTLSVVEISGDGFDEKMTLLRDPVEDTSGSAYTDTTSVGVRAVYNEANGSVILYDNGRVITEYNPETGKELGSFQTQYYVYSMSWLGDYLVIVEKENGTYYLEIVQWSNPTEIAVTGDSTTMTVGESMQLAMEAETVYSVNGSWSSSDERIASVTESGRVVAWREGTVTITASILDGKCTCDYTITVTAADLAVARLASEELTGTVSNNVSDNNYTVWTSVVNSYLEENSDGTFTRVEYVSGTGVLVEMYSPDHKLQSSRTISAELSLFGGFFAGEDNYFLVFGQSNTGESDSVEVMRIVKYDKNWNRVSACSVYGANTYIPFDAGSLRMTETGGSLYVYTCHEMYDEGDGLHHQANMTFVIDESSMTVTDSYYNVLNIAQAGYVSHSFNQFIQTDGEYIYRVDQGDGYPRAVSITKAAVDGSVTDVTYTYALSIQGGTGVNATGVSVGGFEISTDNLLIIGNSVDQSDSSTYSASGQRNIFLTVTDRELMNTEVIWLTDYTSSDGITPRTPQLVKLTEDHFLIMWEEYSSNTGKTTVKAVTVDGDGTITSDIVRLSARLSDCQPIVTSDGLVTWYVTDGSSLTMYTLNPYGLDISKIYLEDTDIYAVRMDSEDGNIAASTVEALAAGRNVEQLIFSRTTSFDRSLELVLEEIEATLGVTVAGDKALLLQTDSSGSLILVDQAMIEDDSVTFSVSTGADGVVVYGYNGDVTGDGIVNASDTLMILRGVSGRTSLDEVEKGFADVNLDGVVNSNDLLAVVKFVSGRTSTLN